MDRMQLGILFLIACIPSCHGTTTCSICTWKSCLSGCTMPCASSPVHAFLRAHILQLYLQLSADAPCLLGSNSM